MTTTADTCRTRPGRPGRECRGVDGLTLPSVHLERLPLSATPIFAELVSR